MDYVGYSLAKNNFEGMPFSESDNIGSSILSVDFYELTMTAAYFTLVSTRRV
jgi:nicotinic acid phosphoribosyltransferase